MFLIPEIKFTQDEDNYILQLFRVDQEKDRLTVNEIERTFNAAFRKLSYRSLKERFNG